MLITEDQVTTNEGGYLPEGLYRIRVLDTKFDMRTAQGKKPMTTLSCEIIEPEQGIVNGKTVSFAGRKCSLYLIHDVTKGGWASQEQVNEFCDKLGINIRDDSGKIAYDTDKHAKYFKGLEFDITLDSREQKKVYAADNAAAGVKRGDPIKDAQGNEISLGYQIQANPSNVPEDPRVSRNEMIAAQPY